MTPTRRHFLKTAWAAGAITVLPFATRAMGAETNSFTSGATTVTVHPVEHASVVFETPAGVIYADPVWSPDLYKGLPAPDTILITHEHGDHFNVDTLHAVIADGTKIITNARVMEKLPEDLAARASVVANGETASIGSASLDAIPAYNMTEGRTKFHPQGRDNGYVLTMGDMRVYLSGDTEDIPEMRALKGIDVAFVSMNMPFTMDVTQAASAIAEFKPGVVYPYHYRGRDGGTQSPADLAKLLGDAVEVRQHDWYNGQLS